MNAEQWKLVEKLKTENEQLRAEVRAQTARIDAYIIANEKLSSRLKSAESAKSANVFV